MTSDDAARSARIARVTALGLDQATIVAFIQQLDGIDRDALIAAGHLHPTAPAKGLDAIEAAHRASGGEALLELAKDVLYGLLFGDDSTQTMFDRVQRELLTLTLPRSKAGAFDFIPAATELDDELFGDLAELDLDDDVVGALVVGDAAPHAGANRAVSRVLPG